MIGMKKAAVGALSALTIAGSVAYAAPAEARSGWSHGHPGYYHGYRHHRGWNNGGALAAGIIGGLALGAIASQAYSAPAYGYAAPACWVRRDVVVNRYGQRVVRSVRTCR